MRLQCIISQVKRKKNILVAADCGQCASMNKRKMKLRRIYMNIGKFAFVWYVNENENEKEMIREGNDTRML